MLEAAKTGPVTLEVAAARALRRLLVNSMAVDGARVVEHTVPLGLEGRSKFRSF